MDLTKFLSGTLSYGVEPILYFLIFMSLISVAVIIERFIAFSEIEHKINKLSSIELRLLMEKRLGILATFGNNAPFCRYRSSPFDYFYGDGDSDN